MTLITLFVGLLSAFFLFASSIKILGWQQFIFKTQLAMFIKYGLNRQVRSWLWSESPNFLAQSPSGFREVGLAHWVLWHCWEPQSGPSGVT